MHPGACADIEHQRTRLIVTANQVQLVVEDVEKFEAELVARKAGLGKATAELVNSKIALADAEERPAPALPDVDALRETIAGAEDHNRLVDRRERLVRLHEELKGYRFEADTLTNEMRKIDSIKTAKIAEQEMPLEGLTFDEETIRYRDTPLEQCSSSEQLRVCTAMALSAQPDVAVLLVREGALLDEAGREEMANVAAESGAQIWMEVVGEDGTIVIEDGSILEPDNG